MSQSDDGSLCCGQDCEVLSDDLARFQAMAMSMRLGDIVEAETELDLIAARGGAYPSGGDSKGSRCSGCGASSRIACEGGLTVDGPTISASSALYAGAREVHQLAQMALDCATPGPRRDCARARILLAEASAKAGEASRG